MKLKTKTLKRDIFIGILVVIIFIGVYAFCNRTQLILKQENYTFEFGEIIELTHEKFLELDEDEDRKQEIIKNTEIHSNFIMQENQEFPKVGEYEITFDFKDTQKIVKVTISDTSSPSITSPKSIEMLQNEDIKEETLKQYFQSQDLSESQLSFDISQYDKNKIGDQTIKVIAKDIYDNQTTHDYKIQNIEKPDPDKYSTKTAITKDDNGNVSQVYIEKIEKPFTLDVKLYCQHDVGARMGCDPAALYQALKYKGYCQNVSLKTFISDMPISPNDNPNNGFAGNPFGQNDPAVLETIFPSPMTSWAKKYGNVNDFSGKSVDDIIDELRKGNPVVVYVTYNFNSPRWKQWHFGRMYSNLHCFTASGYNPVNKTIRLSDPGGAREHRWVSLSTFTRSYNHKKYAIVVR
ncbi:MAG: C39 family peptidase [Coprobacillus sp.]